MTYTQLPAKKRGDTWQFSFEWKAQGEAINLANCTGKMQARLRSDPEIFIEADTVTIIPETGVVNVQFNAASTAEAPVGMYLTDLELTFSNNVVKSSNTFQFTVQTDYTY